MNRISIAVSPLWLPIFIVVLCAGTATRHTAAEESSTRVSTTEVSSTEATADMRGAEHIVRAHLDAMGGQDAISKIQSVKRVGTLSFESPYTGLLDGSFDMLVVPRRKIFHSSRLGAFSTTTAWDGETAWEQGPQGLRKLDGDELERLIGQAHIFFTTGLWRSEGSTIERLADETLDGQSFYVLSYSGGRLPKVKLYLDQTTFLPAQMVMSLEIPGVGQAISVTDSWDHRAHRGVMFPDRISVAIEGLFATEIVFTDTVINGDVDATRFALPE